MKKSVLLFSALLMGSVVLNSCDNSDEPAAARKTEVPAEVISKLVSLGFDVTDKAPIKFDEGYLVEGDIYLTDNDLATMGAGNKVPVSEQYSTNNIVSGTRNITVYIATTFSSTYVTALNDAISRYNALGLRITFSRVTSSSSANIRITRLSTANENSGVLGSSGFPTSSGNPYSSVLLSGILQSTYGLSSAGIATIIAHEIGHCIGFRHTDYYNRAISCGGSTYNEGTAGVGANPIPGTPTTATLAAKSWMLACTDGGNRPFNSDDQVALNYLY